MSVLLLLPPEQCSVPPEKKGLALLYPTNKAFLTMVYKGPFIPTVPKIDTGWDYEMNTWLWIPLNHCLLTGTRNRRPAVASSLVVLTLSSGIQCWTFLSHLILVPLFLQIFTSLKIMWEVGENSTKFHQFIPMHLQDLYTILLIKIQQSFLSSEPQPHLQSLPVTH